MEILVTGISHRRAPVELREKLAVDPEILPEALGGLRRDLGAEEMVILSTCNRVEIYSVHEGAPPGLPQVAALVAARHGVSPHVLEPALYRHQGPEAVRHLFRVASSLDSMVLGEPQITGQVKDAYLAAKEAGATGRVFNRLFQQANHVAGRIRSSTSIGEKNVSVPSVAARMAERIFQGFSTKRLVVVGAGEMADLTVGAFRARGVARVHVVNRTLENARSLADRSGGEAHTLDELAKVLSLGDIVISCIRSETFVITVEDVESAMRARQREPMFLMDLSVPRNIHPQVNEIDNVYLFNIDDLQAIVQQNLVEREKEVERCMPLVEEETRVFLREMTPPDMTALMAQISERVHALLEEEVGRMNGLSEEQRDRVREVNRRVVNKMLHPLFEALRGRAFDGSSHTVTELVRKLFGLNK
jgi:glutamyl-tRNA reductase